MLRKIGFGIALVAVLALTVAVAGEEVKKVKLKGMIACAKCILEVEGVADCQSVLVVKSKDGEPTHYYVVKNEVAKEFGHACQSEKGAVVIGTIEEKDGKLWLTPSKMEAPEKA